MSNASRSDSGGPGAVPRRGVAALVTTVVALILLLNFKTPDVAGLSPSAAPPAAVGQPTAGDRERGADPTTAPGAVAPTPAPLGAGGARRPTPGAPAPTSAPAPTQAARGASGTFTGQAVATRYGVVQVQVSVSSGKVTNVQALELPGDRRLSAQISAYVGPILRDEALQAQNAQIDTITGASYTSEGYRESLQSALDQAGING